MHYCPNQNLSNYFGRALIFEQGGLVCVSPHRTYSCSWPPRPISRWSQNSHQVPCWSPFFTRDRHLLDLQAGPPPYVRTQFCWGKTCWGGSIFWTKTGIGYFEQTWTWWRAWRRSQCWPASGASSGSSPSSSQVTFRLSREEKGVWGSLTFNLFADGRVYNADAELILNSQNQVKWAGF